MTSSDADPPDLLDLLRRQDGVISLAQALAAGLTARAVRGRVARRRWVRVGHRVYRAADHPDTPRVRIRAAMLGAGPEAVLVGASSLYWWRISDVAPALVTIAVPHGRRPRPRRRAVRAP